MSNEFTFGALVESAKEAGGTGDAPPPGEYVGTVVTANTGRSNGGKLKVGIKLRVDGGPHDGAGIWANQYLSPDSPTALDIFFRTFEAMDVPRNWWAQFGSNVDQAGAAVVEAVKGKTVKFTVKDEPYQGQPKMVVGRISRAAGNPLTPATPGVPTPPVPAAAPAGPAVPAAPAAPQAPTVQAPQPPF